MTICEERSSRRRPYGCVMPCSGLSRNLRFFGKRLSFRGGGALTRDKFNGRPATRTFFKAKKISFGMRAGRSTMLKSSKIAIRPMAELSIPASFAIAPTMLPAFT